MKKEIKLETYHAKDSSDYFFCERSHHCHLESQKSRRVRLEFSARAAGVIGSRDDGASKKGG